MNHKKIKRSAIALILIATLVSLFVFGQLGSRIINGFMPSDSRPYKVEFPTEMLSSEQFEIVAQTLENGYDLDFNHIEIFRSNNIFSYKGPETCLECHKDINVMDQSTDMMKEVDLMENLLGSSHYQFYTKSHENVYGFNGEQADNFRMGKIDRPCPKPGSFAMTAWAEVVVTNHGDTLSEGCGQCHIGGQYQAPLGSMMPGYKVLKKEKEAIDCLICHSAAYDMNKKQVISDKHGNRWMQDRSMTAAMSITYPTSQTCLRCHQHNLGGDIYIDETDPSYMQSLLNTGEERPRVLHPGSKRGTPFSPEWDVHAAAGLNCTECHITEGHLIAKGKHTTTMMANDLPDVDVSCISCHGEEAHYEDEELAPYLNAHIEKIACVTCHIPTLHPDNATRRDFANPEFEEKEGIYIYSDISKETSPGLGIGYVWWNGDATFLGNPIGDNPNGAGIYKFYDPDNIWPEFKDFDYDGWFEDIMRPIAAKKPSKLYAMKFFNGRQHIDLQNIGPFGGMYVPYNLPAYYLTGDADLAAGEEMKKSMMKKMYGTMFDVYMMNRFLKYMYTDGWNTKAYKDVSSGEKVEARWLPNDAMLEISHSIRRDGAYSCRDCHTANGVLNWKALGYSKEEVEKHTLDPLN